MNILDAIRSGKPFKRGSIDWLTASEEGINAPHVRYISNCIIFPFRREYILADDWEIQEEKIEVTREQAERVFGAFFRDYGNTEIGFNKLKAGFFQGLGFKD